MIMLEVLYCNANETTHTYSFFTKLQLGYIVEYSWQAYPMYYFHMQYKVMLITTVCLSS